MLQLYGNRYIFNPGAVLSDTKGCIMSNNLPGDCKCHKSVITGLISVDYPSLPEMGISVVNIIKHGMVYAGFIISTIRHIDIVTDMVT